MLAKLVWVVGVVPCSCTTGVEVVIVTLTKVVLCQRLVVAVVLASLYRWRLWRS